MTLYFNQPDTAGHQGGPNSTLVNQAIQEVDDAIGRLWEGLVERNISECVNIMIVSDHGMSAFNASQLVVASEVS